MGLIDIFNKKRTGSQYLKYENGEIITIDKVSPNQIDAPKLDINKSTVGDTKEEKFIPKDINIDKDSKKGKYTIIFKLSIIFLLLILLRYTIILSTTFVGKTEGYVSGLSETNNQSSQTVDESNSSNTQSGSISSEKHEVLEQTVNKDELNKLLGTVVDVHKITYDSINQSKRVILGYMNNEINLNSMTTQINQSYSTSKNLYSSLQSNKELFDKFNSQELYSVLLERLKNNLDLLTELNKNNTVSSMIPTLNDHILKENKLLEDQTVKLKSCLDKNSIHYTINNGQISWEI